MKSAVVSIFVLYCIITVMMPSKSAFSQDTLSLRPGPEDGNDASVSDYYPNRNYANDIYIKAFAWTISGYPVVVRSFFSFNLDTLPSGSEIIGAYLDLFGNPYHGQWDIEQHSTLSGPNTSFLQMVTEPWDESTITWINQPEVSDAIYLVLHTSSYPEENYLNLDVMDMIRAMYQEPEYYFGFCLQLQIEWPYRSMTFISSDFVEPELRPELIIIYKHCESPVAGFEFEVSNEKTVAFHDNSTSAETWLWDFGDGYQSNLQNPHHTYDDYGFYNVCLYITDSCGESFFCDTVTTCNFTVADFGFTMVDLEVFFTDSSKNTTNWWWNFGDGYYSELQNTTHKFPGYGAYQVCLKASNDCSSDIFCDSIKVVHLEGLSENQMLPLRIYPDPVTSCLFLESGSHSGVSEILNVKILNQSGSVLMQSEVADSGLMKFELQNLKAGLYIFYLKSSAGYFVHKFVKL